MGTTIYWEKSLHTRSELIKSARNNLSSCHLKVVFQSPYKLRTFFRFEDTLDKKICSNLVYPYWCSSCNAAYHGKTYQRFFARAGQHIGISNLTGKGVKNVKESVFPDHLF